MICPDCGHPTYKHRTHGAPVNAGGPDDPAPCTGILDGHPKGPYTFCGCTREFPLDGQEVLL